MEAVKNVSQMLKQTDREIDRLVDRWAVIATAR